MQFSFHAELFLPTMVKKVISKGSFLITSLLYLCCTFTHKHHVDVIFLEPKNNPYSME